MATRRGMLGYRYPVTGCNVMIAEPIRALNDLGEAPSANSPELLARVTPNVAACKRKVILDGIRRDYQPA